MMKRLSLLSEILFLLPALLLLASCDPTENSSNEKGAPSPSSPTVDRTSADPFADTDPFKDEAQKSAPAIPLPPSPEISDSAEKIDPFGDRERMAAAPATPEASNATSPAESPASPGSPTADPNQRKSALPELHVTIDGGNLIVTGAIGSRIQHERILETLAKEFPDLKLDAQFELDYDRSQVNWGGRVAYPFLVDFLKAVDSPSVIYEEGVVTLGGRVKPGYSLQAVTEGAIDTFSDSNTRDLVNHLRDSKGNTAEKRK